MDSVFVTSSLTALTSSHQEFVVFSHKANLTFSTTVQEISSPKPAGVFPLRPEMIKETDFEKNYAATNMNKKGCYGESRQNKSVTTNVHTNTCLDPKCNLARFLHSQKFYAFCPCHKLRLLQV